MNRAEWQKFHGFTDETAAHIDKVKKLFGGKIEIIRTNKEYDDEMIAISKSNKVNIDRLWIK